MSQLKILFQMDLILTILKTIIFAQTLLNNTHKYRIATTKIIAGSKEVNGNVHLTTMINVLADMMHKTIEKVTKEIPSIKIVTQC